MKNILSAKHSGILKELAVSQVLLAFDYDGTLAPIVADPAQAKMRNSTHKLMALLARKYPSAVISGRARESLARFLSGIELKQIIGNHGAEWEEQFKDDCGQLLIGARENKSPQIRDMVVNWRVAITSYFAKHSGIVLEDKGLSLALHYRMAPDRNKARDSINSLVASLPDCKPVPGILVVNLVHEAAPNKGDALLRLAKITECSQTIFIGDDVTDEDAFVVGRNGTGVSIRVGYNSDSNAEYYVRSQQAIDELLRRLCYLRQEPPSSRTINFSSQIAA